MRCWPARSPVSCSRRFPGGTHKSGTSNGSAGSPFQSCNSLTPRLHANVSVLRERPVIYAMCIDLPQGHRCNLSALAMPLSGENFEFKVDIFRLELEQVGIGFFGDCAA